MTYLIHEVDRSQQPALIQALIDFSFDSEQIFVAPCNGGFAVDFGEPLLNGALDRLIKRLGKVVRPLEAESREANWQVVSTHVSPED